eukprot:Hpha_TRINITY_DN23032_c0_g1::TRINITY_DN23032_c0_g1_i1::g.109334::m.109334
MSDAAVLADGSPIRRAGQKFWIRGEDGGAEDVMGVFVKGSESKCSDLKAALLPLFHFEGAEGAGIGDIELLVDGGAEGPLPDSRTLQGLAQETFIVRAKRREQNAPAPCADGGGLGAIWNTCLDDAVSSDQMVPEKQARSCSPDLAYLSEIQQIPVDFHFDLVPPESQPKAQALPPSRGPSSVPSTTLDGSVQNTTAPDPSVSASRKSSRHSLNTTQRRENRLGMSQSGDTYLEDTRELLPVPHATSRDVSKALSTVRGPASEWQKQIEAMTTLRRLAVHHPMLLTYSLNGVLLAVTESMSAGRSKVRRNALLTVENIVTGDLKTSRALDGQLDPLVTEVAKLASSDDVDMIRHAATETCEKLIANITDAQRLKVVTALLSQSTTAKNGTLRSQAVHFISVAVRSLGATELLRYPRLGLFLTAVENFTRDASEQCRANARDLAHTISDTLGGSANLARVANEHLTQEKADSLVASLSYCGSPAARASPARGLKAPRSPTSAP